MQHLAVVGGVAAGLSAASRARKRNPQLRITVFEQGPVVSYGACGLPYWVEGQVQSADELIVHTPDFFRTERNIDVRVNARVAEIQHARRRLLMASGEEIPYDRLVLATGARAQAPAIEGLDHGNAFTLHTWHDFHRLQDRLQQSKPASAIVIGASFLGLEMAEALRTRGLSVQLLEAGAHPLAWGEDWLSAKIRERLERFQVPLQTGTTARQIHAGGVDTYHADLVILATGIRPSTALAESAGIRLGKTGAIAVDEHLETSLSGIYAAGDCAETWNLVSKAPDWVPLGAPANKMGRIAGANATGGRERFAGVAGTSIVRVFGLAVAQTGLSPSKARQCGLQPVSVHIQARARAKYFFGEMIDVELVADRRSGRLLGAAIAGDRDVEGRINVVATALTAGLDVEAFEQLDLCYAPPYATVWDPLLIAAQQLRKELA